MRWLSVEVAKFDGSGSQHMFVLRDFDVCYKRLSAFNHAAIYDEVQGDGVMQSSLYQMPVYDELLKELAVARDAQKRQEIISEMQKLDREYLLRIPLFSLANMAYVNEKHLELPEIYGNLWYRYDLHFDEWKLVSE